MPDVITRGLFLSRYYISETIADWLNEVTFNMRIYLRMNK